MTDKGEGGFRGQMKQGAYEQLGSKMAEWRWAAWMAQSHPSHLCHSMCELERRSSHSASGYLGHWHPGFGLSLISFPPSQGGLNTSGGCNLMDCRTAVCFWWSWWNFSFLPISKTGWSSVTETLDCRKGWILKLGRPSFEFWLYYLLAVFPVA